MDPHSLAYLHHPAQTSFISAKMVKYYDEIPLEFLPWIEEQELFWVATAPLSPTGHVNVSPKGVRGSFHIVSPTKVWYQDLSGSGRLCCSRIGVELLSQIHFRFRDDCSYP